MGVGMKFLVADDHPLVRDALGEGQRADGDARVCSRQISRRSASLRGGRPDLLVIDLNMPGMNGLEGRGPCADLPSLADRSPPARTTLRPFGPSWRPGRRLRAEERPPELLLQAIRLVRAGGVYLPARRSTISHGAAPTSTVRADAAPARRAATAPDRSTEQAHRAPAGPDRRHRQGPHRRHPARPPRQEPHRGGGACARARVRQRDVTTARSRAATMAPASALRPMHSSAPRPYQWETPRRTARSKVGGPRMQLPGAHGPWNCNASAKLASPHPSISPFAIATTSPANSRDAASQPSPNRPATQRALAVVRRRLPSLAERRHRGRLGQLGQPAGSSASTMTATSIFRVVAASPTGSSASTLRSPFRLRPSPRGTSASSPSFSGHCHRRRMGESTCRVAPWRRPRRDRARTLRPRCSAMSEHEDAS